ncbi:radical SAM protein [Desulfocarbo indianensis]|nr:radical SAM protein [Desulfocarbo indianensis]
MQTFAGMLSQNRLSLDREACEALQINVGLLCNQACNHCHLEAGPRRKEIMDQATMAQVVEFARRGDFTGIDITGGAPEMNPSLPLLIESLRPLTPRLMLRANLTALGQAGQQELMGLLARSQVVVVASLPALNPSQTDAQRGSGVFASSLDVLRKLNALGYGQEGSGLELNLVSNPAGAFLPPAQSQAEERFRAQLQRRWDIRFNQLYTFANVPLGRFARWLRQSGNYDAYLEKLIDSFNSCAVECLMCRRQVSVAWDGYLYDCDFNLAAGLPLGGRRTHVNELSAPPKAGEPIALGEHCFTCTAGSGFT